MEVGIFVFVFSIIFMLFYLIVGIIQHKNNNKVNVDKKIVKNKEIALLLPCYNEAAILKTTISGLKKLKYKNLEIIFINDGSKDNTLEVLKESLQLELKSELKNTLDYKVKYKEIKDVYKSTSFENLYVIDKVNGGKADSLNAGIDFTKKDYVITLDADTVIKEDALEYINMDLQDEDVIAIGGNVMVLQGIENCKNKDLQSNTKCKCLEYAQFMEYLSVFYIIRNALCKLKSLAIISGAFGVFDRKVMLEIGCFEKTIGEDMDISIKFNKYALKNSKKILYDDKAICFTEAPNNIKDFCSQRIRWQKGLIDVLIKHKKFFLTGIFKNKLALVTLCDVLILGYTSIIIMFLGWIVLIFDVFEKIHIGKLLYIEIGIGLLIFAIYSIFNMFIAKDNNLSFNNANKFKLFRIHIYILLIYKPIIMWTTIYGSIMYIFKKDGWKSITRTGNSYNIEVM